jgi:hypothetical protein
MIREIYEIEISESLAILLMGCCDDPRREEIEAAERFLAKGYCKPLDMDEGPGFGYCGFLMERGNMATVRGFMKP